jgi:general secretion pathway protein L
MISRVFALWIEGLAAAWTAVGGLMRGQRRFQLRTNSRRFMLYSAGQSVPDLLLTIDGERLDTVPERVLKQTRGGIFEVVVPAAAILRQRLDVLPAESLPYVEKVVLHQLETLFPWRAEDALHAALIEKRADGAFDVSVVATTRSAIAPALMAAEACGASEVVVVGDGENVDEARRVGILAATGSETRKKLSHARLIARYSLFALLALAACTIGWTTFAFWSLSNDVAALDQDIADRRAILKRFADATGPDQPHGLDSKKRSATVAVEVLDELSAVLPDSTYLTDLSLDTGLLRITGVSADAAALVPLLEGSGHFKNATFYAPTTRLAGPATDRFSIEATVVPRGPGAP